MYMHAYTTAACMEYFAHLFVAWQYFSCFLQITNSLVMLPKCLHMKQWRVPAQMTCEKLENGCHATAAEQTKYQHAQLCCLQITQLPQSVCIEEPLCNPTNYDTPIEMSMHTWYAVALL